MEYQFSIEDLARECKVSKQSIYNLIKKNKEFVRGNSEKQHQRIMYNQEVLKKFLAYYGRSKAEEAQRTDSSAEIDQVDISIIHEKDAKIEALQVEIEALKAQLEEKEAERKELLAQNGALILTVQQQQQEKMLLLPAAKKTIAERIRGFFTGSKKNDG